MKLGIIGCGAIGTDVAKAADEMEEIDEIYLYDIVEEKAKKLADDLKKAKEVLKAELELEEFDKFLREKGDLRNPGSLADIMAIALGLLLLKGYTLNL